ncbi:MAG: hypothetical protein IPH88_19355 [Bacteroidales bacterium]|nr:hypothetical protein [Bacteroidales bacterium]
MPNIQNIHYGPFLTVGYKWVGLTASYQITSVFALIRNARQIQLSVY